MKINVLKIVRPIAMYIMLLLKPIIRLINWQTIHAINVATEKEARTYAPAWLSKRLIKWGFIPGGFMKTPFGWGLVTGAFVTNDQIRESQEICSSLNTSISKYRAKRIALNGVIPSAFIKYDLFPEDEKFTKGDLGTIFMLADNINEILSRYEYTQNSPIAILGCGFVGLNLAEYLLRINPSQRVYGFDFNHRTNRDINNFAFFGPEFEKISDCKIVVLLTTEGDSGIETIFENLSKKTIILADTHPKVSSKMWKRIGNKDVIGFESAATAPGFRYYPHYQGWDPTTIPGCVLQAILESAAGKVFSSQEEHDAFAKKSGFTGRLDVPRPLKELVNNFSV